MATDDVDALILELEAACLSGVESLSRMLDRHPELLSASLPYGLGHLLHIPSIHGQIEVVTYLLNQGVPVDPLDDQAMTPFLFAAKGGHIAVCETLLKAGADPKALDMRGWSALHWSMRLHDLERRNELAQLLLKWGLSLDIYCALVLGDLAETSKLISGREDISRDVLANLFVGAAIQAASSSYSVEIQLFGNSTKSHKHFATVINNLVSKGAPLKNFVDFVKIALSLDNIVIAKCMLIIGDQRSILPTIKDSRVIEGLFAAASRSKESDLMMGLLNKYGFSDPMTWNE